MRITAIVLLFISILWVIGCLSYVKAKNTPPPIYHIGEVYKLQPNCDKYQITEVYRFNGEWSYRFESGSDRLSFKESDSWRFCN